MRTGGLVSRAGDAGRRFDGLCWRNAARFSVRTAKLEWLTRSWEPIRYWSPTSGQRFKLDQMLSAGLIFPIGLPD